ncbi:tetratricopeptide repeat protein [Leptospira sp. 2 VSF19]|uniref:Tetratricopeptide repeat protein n=1 Tax=Leptospira soteropolitanensis TaxID=2950025 RepID=A0AAW5VFJ2_9LEPT|nr:tetratricopeptide repeat protein [Leptospira soteropolitanensis]MCW7493863.1 tetratricopeptide repeat protein [Leptospira soteropolitanensis]MCW7501457.1 tetratricopeptide repeat protein [Leptospira soteropolitanensis]MCW7523780.1 tetratricopeptide repeat protein [Leptospira soteropolitanensis]MCW7527644.1 tetratricopeptide repeat protein [Leptospira soteropolitanensis]MCW7531498.1 tetratricopeptide repeat protein [Leptospira soteropolitanensis]
MKKTILTILVLALTASISAGESSFMNEDLDSLINQYDKETLTVISNELVKLASEEEGMGEYDLASGHYTRAIKIREAIGMSEHKSFASIQYLASLAHSKAGNFCEASSFAKKASEGFRHHGISKFEHKANIEQKEYARACAVVAFK